MTENTKVESKINWLKNNKFTSILIFLAIVFIGISNFTDSLLKFNRQLKTLIGVETNQDKQINILNRQLRPLYFENAMIGGDLVSNNRLTSLDSLNLIQLDKYIELIKELGGNYTLVIEGHASKMNLIDNFNISMTRV